MNGYKAFLPALLLSLFVAMPVVQGADDIECPKENKYSVSGDLAGEVLRGQNAAFGKLTLVEPETGREIHLDTGVLFLDKYLDADSGEEKIGTFAIQGDGKWAYQINEEERQKRIQAGETIDVKFTVISVNSTTCGEVVVKVESLEETVGGSVDGSMDESGTRINELKASTPTVDTQTPEQTDGAGTTSNQNGGGGTTSNQNGRGGTTSNQTGGGGTTSNQTGGGGTTSNQTGGGGTTSNQTGGGDTTSNQTGGGGTTSNQTGGGGTTSNQIGGGGKTPNPTGVTRIEAFVKVYWLYIAIAGAVVILGLLVALALLYRQYVGKRDAASKFEQELTGQQHELHEKQSELDNKENEIDRLNSDLGVFRANQIERKPLDDVLTQFGVEDADDLSARLRKLADAKGGEGLSQTIGRATDEFRNRFVRGRGADRLDGDDASAELHRKLADTENKLKDAEGRMLDLRRDVEVANQSKANAKSRALSLQRELEETKLSKEDMEKNWKDRDRDRAEAIAVLTREKDEQAQNSQQQIQKLSDELRKVQVYIEEREKERDAVLKNYYPEYCTTPPLQDGFEALQASVANGNGTASMALAALHQMWAAMLNGAEARYVLQAVHEFGRHYLTYQEGMGKSLDEALKEMSVWAGAFNEHADGVFGIQVPVLNSPVDVSWMTFPSGTRSISNVKCWGIRDAMGNPSRKAEVS